MSGIEPDYEVLKKLPRAWRLVGGEPNTGWISPAVVPGIGEFVYVAHLDDDPRWVTEPLYDAGVSKFELVRYDRYPSQGEVHYGLLPDHPHATELEFWQGPICWDHRTAEALLELEKQTMSHEEDPYPIRVAILEDNETFSGLIGSRVVDVPDHDDPAEVEGALGEGNCREVARLDKEFDTTYDVWIEGDGNIPMRLFPDVRQLGIAKGMAFGYAAMFSALPVAPTWRAVVHPQESTLIVYSISSKDIQDGIRTSGTER